MHIVEKLLLPGYLPLFVLSTFSSILLFTGIAAMAFILFGLYKSNVTSYHNKITALGQQIEAMQQHLDYASREETKARADAKRSAIARENLLTSLNHEIRTPMNGILGMSILLEETTLNAEQKDYIDTIISSGKMLLNKVDEVMANDMLEQSKINQSNTATQHKNTDLRNCVEEVMDTFAVKASERSIELLYEIDVDVPLQVLTDNQRLHKVLTNLVEKVIEDKPEQVCIGVYIIKHNTTNTSPVLGFTITAKPLGNATAIAMLQEEGKVLSDINSEEGQNTKYLGLAISKKLVEEMSGEIKALNDSNAGFIFTIPLHAGTLVGGNSSGYNLKDFEGKSVLIVNSNIISASFLTNQLRNWNLQPVIVTNGNEAMHLLAEQSFSLLIVEMHLNDMSGLELATQIKNLYPQIPLMLLNQVNNNEYNDAAIVKEITILIKPVKQHTLFDNLLSNLRQIRKTGQTQEVSVKNLSEEFSKKYPLRILIAEDNAVNQKWATKILGKLGYHPDIAYNGHIALEMVSKTAYDIILMDVQMPEMDGLEATRMIRVCLSKQPTIIAMTANVMHGDRMACMQAGMDDYISKPVQLTDLVNMLEKWALVINDKKTLQWLP